MQKKQRVIISFGGRFDSTPSEFFSALDYCFQDPNVLADDVLMTEVSPARYRKLVRQYATSRKLHFWHPRRPGANECVIFSKNRLRHRGFLKLTDLTIKHGRTAPITLVEAKVYGGPWLSVVHTPAHNFGLKPGVWATKIYQSMVGPWRARLRRRSRGLHGAAAAGDFNLALNRKMWQEYLLKDVAGWQFSQPIGPGREIVGLATNMKIVESAVELDKQPGFDHPPVKTVVRVP